MKQSLSSLAFGGSILEAVAEAKRQKKLFLVYIAGNNSASKQLETSTWNDTKVSEMIAKYCIFFYILEESYEASNFSAIYPQNSAPCITAVSYNGVKLWENEGFVAAYVLVSCIEKAWLSLHLQETTAAFLTAALASGKQTASGTSEIASSDQASPVTHAAFTDDRVASHSGQPSNCEPAKDGISHEDVPKEINSQLNDGAFREPSHANVLDNDGNDEPTAKSETAIKSQDPDEIYEGDPEVACPVTVKKTDLLDNHLDNANEASQKNGQEPHEVVSHCNVVIRKNDGDLSEVSCIDKDETTEVEKVDASNSLTIKSDFILLNIRLPEGSSLQVKFSVMDTLRMVKDYIYEHETSSLGSFTLAIPYPRRVFNDQDLVSTLSELGFFNRQALVVIPVNKTNSHNGRGSSGHHPTYSSTEVHSSDGSEGYWASLKIILSYFNPLSYIRRASSPSAAVEFQSGPWQYGTNSSPQSNAPINARSVGGSSFPVRSSDQNMPAGGRNSSSRSSTTRFGANIHSLKHDEDEDRFMGRNAFWNGNSTQFGGDNDGK